MEPCVPVLAAVVLHDDQGGGELLVQRPVSGGGALGAQAFGSVVQDVVLPVHTTPNNNKTRLVSGPGARSP